MQWYYSETIMILYSNDIIIILPSKLRSQVSRWDGDISCQILLGARCSDRWTGTRWYIAYIGFMYVCMHVCMYACMYYMQSDQPLVLMWDTVAGFDPSPYLIMLSRQNITHLVDQWWTSLTSDADSSLEKRTNKISGLPNKRFLPSKSIPGVPSNGLGLDWLDPMFTWPFKTLRQLPHTCKIAIAYGASPWELALGISLRSWETVDDGCSLRSCPVQVSCWAWAIAMKSKYYPTKTTICQWSQSGRILIIHSPEVNSWNGFYPHCPWCIPWFQATHSHGIRPQRFLDWSSGAYTPYASQNGW